MKLADLRARRVNGPLLTRAAAEPVGQRAFLTCSPEEDVLAQPWAVRVTV